MIIFILVGTQILFTSGDLLARANLAKTGFSSGMFFTWWFGLYILLRTVATVGQLYVLSQVQIGRAYGIFGAFGIVMASLVGFFWLKESLTIWQYIGISLSILAFLTLTLKR